MRYLIAAWAAPLAIFWGWYFLSANDIDFGYLILSRRMHDLVFELYGQMLGIDPATIPGLVARACVLDSLLIVAIYAFRRRTVILAYVRELRARLAGAQSRPSA
mgnify:CR=1 FL=1